MGLETYFKVGDFVICHSHNNLLGEVVEVSEDSMIVEFLSPKEHVGWSLDPDTSFKSLYGKRCTNKNCYAFFERDVESGRIVKYIDPMDDIYKLRDHE